MKWLHQNYQIVSLPQILQQDNYNKKIAITFDDGFKSWYAKAIPVLKEFNIPATFFVNSGLVGLQGKEMRNFFSKNNQRTTQHLEAISLVELQAIAQDPLFDIGSHTINHIDFSKKEISKEEIIFEIETDKKRLEAFCYQKIDFFAFPFGANWHMTQQVKDVLKDLNFKAAFSIIPGQVVFDPSKPYAISRDALQLNDSIWYWKARLAGGYDRLRAAVGFS